MASRATPLRPVPATSRSTCSYDEPGYTDWKLGLSYALPKGLTVGAFYTDTNAEEASYTVASGANWADKQAAVYLQKTF
ncbi:MAG: hypothetical protein MZV65_54290 [Chromatiales bacterium]|nr:hypothetical protein [Chromatiales bacterium]